MWALELNSLSDEPSQQYQLFHILKTPFQAETLPRSQGSSHLPQLPTNYLTLPVLYAKKCQ